MNQSFNENKSLAILLGILAFVLLGAFYYYVIYPKSEIKTRTSHSIEQLKSETTELHTQVAGLNKVEVAVTDDFELRKKLPVSRELDDLLRTLNEVELMSESKIVSISFNNYDEGVAESNYIPPSAESLTRLRKTI